MQLDAGISLLGSKHREKVLKLNRRLVPTPQLIITLGCTEASHQTGPTLAEWCKAGEKGFGKADCYSRCSQRSARLFWKRGRKWHREYHDSSADHKKTLWMPSLSSQLLTSPSKLHISLGWVGCKPVWSGEHDLGSGKDKWDGNAPLRAVILRGLSSTPCTSYGPGGLSQEPPAGPGPCSSKGNQEESGSHAGPPAQLLMSFPPVIHWPAGLGIAAPESF